MIIAQDKNIVHFSIKARVMKNLIFAKFIL